MRQTIGQLRFGIAYIEAAFYGIPSIASNIGGTPEAVIHEETV